VNCNNRYLPLDLNCLIGTADDKTANGTVDLFIFILYSHSPSLMCDACKEQILLLAVFCYERKHAFKAPGATSRRGKITFSWMRCAVCISFHTLLANLSPGRMSSKPLLAQPTSTVTGDVPPTDEIIASAVDYASSVCASSVPHQRVLCFISREYLGLWCFLGVRGVTGRSEYHLIRFLPFTRIKPVFILIEMKAKFGFAIETKAPAQTSS